MRKLFYMGLEPYEGRYTLQLQDWSENKQIHLSRNALKEDFVDKSYKQTNRNEKK